MAEGKLKVSREEFAKGISELIEEGKALSNVSLTYNDNYSRWLYKIENLIKFSFDHPDKYLEEYNELGGVPFLTSDMDVEKLAHEGLIVILLFLDSMIERIPGIHCKNNNI